MALTMITIVSGLPRSGTSMMMQMLVAGGLEALTDGVRRADRDNPRGYFEFERVKQTKKDASWLEEAEGKVVKMVSMLLLDLPPGRDYRVVFMRRDLGEILKSQAVMLENLGKAAGPPDAEMRALYESHLRQVEAGVGRQPGFRLLWCDYSDVLLRPRETAERVAGFVGSGLDVDRMVEAVDPALYRNRVASRLPTVPG